MLTIWQMRGELNIILTENFIFQAQQKMLDLAEEMIATV